MRTSEPYPLGFVSGAHEIIENWPEEAQMLGVITILWNRLEHHLKRIFLYVVGEKPEFHTALWESETTHKGRMRLLTLALAHIELSDIRRSYLGEIIQRVGVLSGKRNALTHGEYVLDNNDRLKARKPGSKTPPSYTPSDVADLREVISALQEVDAYISALTLDYVPKDLLESVAAAAKSLRGAAD